MKAADVKPGMLFKLVTPRLLAVGDGHFVHSPMYAYVDRVFDFDRVVCTVYVDVRLPAARQFRRDPNACMFARTYLAERPLIGGHA